MKRILCWIYGHKWLAVYESAMDADWGRAEYTICVRCRKAHHCG